MDLVDLVMKVLHVWRGTQVWIRSLENWPFSMLIKVCVCGGGISSFDHLRTNKILTHSTMILILFAIILKQYVDDIV